MRYRDYGYRTSEREMMPQHPRVRYDSGFRGGPRPRGYGRDYWWIGESEMRPRGAPTGYDEAYRRFNRQTRPRFSPVGGMYPPVGGWTMAGNAPEPLREYRHFSDWTRWF